MEARDGITIRSFRLAFDIERRLYKLDRWRLPLPHGLPLRTIAYAAAALLAVLVIGRLPILGQIAHAVPPPIRLLLVPGVAAHLLTQVEVDGRAAHRFAVSWLRAHKAPRRAVAFRSRDEPAVARLATVTVTPDEHAGHLRPAVVHGPARVLIRYPASARRRGRTLLIAASGTQPMRRGKQVTLGRGQRLIVR